MKEYNEQAVETLDDAGCIIANKNIIIDNLQARIAELEEENARLNSSPTVEACRQMIRDKAVIEASTLHEQLAAEQLNNKLLRDALEHCMADGDFDTDDARTSFKEGMKALATPISTEALDKYVAEKVKESHKVIPREGLVPHAYQLEATHNKAEYWFKLGHSEEMAAKGESVICMAHAVFAWRNAAYSKAKEVATMTRQRDLAVEALMKCRYRSLVDKVVDDALEAIKESEGK